MSQWREARSNAGVALREQQQIPRLNVLSLSCAFPAPGREGHGVFVRARLEALSRYAEIKVVSPVAILDYSDPQGRLFGNRTLPDRLIHGNLETFYPGWVYPPGGNFLNPLLLAAQLLPRIRKLRREFRFDLIDAHFGYPDGIATSLLAKALGVPFVVTFRGNETMHGANPHICKWLRRMVRTAARVIAVSGPLGDYAVSLGAPKEKVKIIPNGIDSGIFYPRNALEMRRKHHLPLDVPVVLSAGQLIKRKGHHRVVRALAAMRGMDWQFLIAGGPGREDPYDDQIRQTVAESGFAERVRFLGQVPPNVMAELMSAADVFCLATSREGWPNVVHEAMACGAPVIASAVGGIPDMVPSEDYGLVVPAGCTASLSRALQLSLQRDWDRPRIAAWAKLRDWDLVAREVAAELLAISASRPADCK